MANESQYYNPIIQAMIASSQQQQEQQRIAQQSEAQKIQAKQFEENLVREQKLAENQHEYQTGMLQNAQKQLEAQLELQHIEKLKGLADLSAHGVDISKYPQLLDSFKQQTQPPVQSGVGQQPPFQQSQQPPQGQPPQGQQPDISQMVGALPGPAAEIQRIHDLAAAQSSGAAQGALSSQILFEREHGETEKMLQENQQKFLSDQQTKKIASEENIAKLSRQSQQSIAGMENATHLQIANMQFNPSPEATRGMILGAGTGQYQLNPANPQERAALTAMQGAGWREIPKQDVETLKQAQALGPLIDKIQTVVDQLPTSQVGGFLQGHVQNIKNELGIPTKLATQMGQIHSQLVTQAKLLGEVSGGRITTQQIELAADALVDPHLTKELGQQQVDNLKQLVNVKFTNGLMGGVPKEQQEALYHTQGIKPSWLLTAPNTDTRIFNGKPVTGKIDYEKSIMNPTGKPVYDYIVGGK